MNQDAKGANTRRVQQREIAARAGVAPSTVSRVLNASGTISLEVKQRVLTAASELGYRPALLPNLPDEGFPLGVAPRGEPVTPAQPPLRHIGLLADLGIIGQTLDPFHAGIFQGVEQECTRHGVKLSYMVSQGGPGGADDTLAQAREHAVDGVLFLSFDNAATINAVLEQGLPAGLVNTDYPDLPIDSYLPDNMFAAARAVRYLVQQGHRRIAHTTHSRRQTIRRRHQGYKLGLEETGLPYDPTLVFESSTSADVAYPTLRNQFATHARDFTAIFCANDVAAIAAISALSELGLRVPQDISIIGFDDIPPAALLAPPLTTMRVDFAELGARAVRGLLDRAVRPHGPSVRFEQACTLIERATVATLAAPTP